MLERYKLRLGDGTVLGVDLQGLTTWALDGKAMVQAADSHEWFPLKEFLAAERAAARRAARQRGGRATLSEAGTPRPLPLVYPKPREEKAAVPSAAPPPEPPSIVAESLEGQAIEEPPLGPQESPPEPTEAATPSLDLVDLVVPPETIASPDAPFLAGTPVTEVVPDVPDVPVTAETAMPAFAADSSTPSVLGEEPAEAIGEEAHPSWIPEDAEAPALTREPVYFRPDGDPQPSTLEEDFPSITQEPLEAAAAPPPPFPPAPDLFASLPDAPETAPTLPGASLQVLADDPARPSPPSAKETWRPDVALPVISLKPLEPEPVAEGLGTYDGQVPDPPEPEPRRSAWQEMFLRWLRRGIVAYDALVTGWIRRLARGTGSVSPSGPPTANASAAADIPWAPSPAVGSSLVAIDGDSHERLEPPPALQDIPVVRLADLPEPAEEGDVFDGEGRLAEVWRWTWRVVVTGAVLAGVLFAALRWEVWVPKADRIGHSVFTRIEQIREARDRRERHRQALQEATERLPHLSPQTIQLLLESSSASLPDPPEMFRIASEAADRGTTALTAAERQELKELRRELTGALRPSERERIREYDAARARRLVFPFEGRDVLELVGRGAYALPPESRERLQELNAKAIAAGLPPDPEATPGPTAEP